MALAVGRNKFIYDAERDAICFLLRGESGAVRCLVPRRVITEAIGFRQATPRHLIAMVQRHRSTFQDLAQRKYRRGAFECDGSLEIGVSDVEMAAIARSLHQIPRGAGKPRR